MTTLFHFHVGTVEGKFFISVKTKTGPGSIDKDNRIVPVDQRRTNTCSADVIDKPGKKFCLSFLQLGKIALTYVKR